MIYWRLLLAFLQIGLFSIGGGYAAMPLIQQQTVELNGWLTLKEFTDLITIAEMTPGPIAVNAATFVGIRIAGFSGALVATIGCILPAGIIVSILAFIYTRYRSLPVLQSILTTLRPVVVALIFGAGLSILRMVSLHGNGFSPEHIRWLGLALFGGALILLRRFRCNPILVMCACGAVNLALGQFL